MWKLYVGLFFAGIVGAACFGGYKYFKFSQNKLEALQQEVATKVVTIQQQEQTITSLREQELKNEALRKELDIKLQVAEQYEDRLQKILGEHDLSKLSEAKPGLIEKRINDATKSVFADIEQLTK